MYNIGHLSLRYTAALCPRLLFNKPCHHGNMANLTHAVSFCHRKKTAHLMRIRAREIWDI